VKIQEVITTEICRVRALPDVGKYKGLCYLYNIPVPGVFLVEEYAAVYGVPGVEGVPPYEEEMCILSLNVPE
jgi:hypothetical protein